MYKGASTVNIIDSDALTLNVVPWLNSVQMWFYDGPHDRETTRQAVEHYWDTFTQEAILVFDDANWQPVVDGAREGIKSMSGHIGYEKLMLNDTEDAAAWWNGLYIAVIYK
jgi:predicted O-methyltransferase YrrM